MTRLLLIDCRSGRVARYEGRKQASELVLIRGRLDQNAAGDLEVFRIGGWAALDAVQGARRAAEG